jgi:hypothetical protein
MTIKKKEYCHLFYQLKIISCICDDHEIVSGTIRLKNPCRFLAFLYPKEVFAIIRQDFPFRSLAQLTQVDRYMKGFGRRGKAGCGKSQDLSLRGAKRRSNLGFLTRKSRLLRSLRSLAMTTLLFFRTLIDLLYPS